MNAHQVILNSLPFDVRSWAFEVRCSPPPSRLFCVAITRAKDELYLTYPMMNPKSYTGDVICRASQFLEDFPQELVEEWNVGNEDAWSDDEPF